MDSGLRIRDGDLIAGFVKGLSVIETFDQERNKLSIADVARLTGLERASARRCLLTLVHEGYAEFDGKFFRLTPRVLKLGYAYLSSTPLPRIIQPFLEQLSEAIHESSSASILDRGEIVYIARSAQRRVMLIGLNVGSRLPAYCASMGRVLLAALPEEEARRRLEATKREKHTPKTLTGLSDLMKELAKVRQQGYALIDEELEIGLRSIAVPILDARGSVMAAANVGVQAQRVSSQTLIEEVLPRLFAIQGELRKLLG
jgi:IclR family pca regulon transcriptional regulator